MNVVIMGSGRIGGTLANTLSAEGHNVTIIDINSASFEKYLAADFRGQTILGDGIDEDVLREAGIERADAFVAAAYGDNHNLMASQIAKVSFGVQRVVCRCNDQVRADIYSDLGLATVSPSRIAADGLRDALMDEERHRQDVAGTIGRLLVR
ncbi:MAG TPA: TrkA family potassium uptake protein [Chloroflexota bacterium]|nr:TrkA family potassium uptake protein [Chloroflexota bacterium]